MKLRYTIVSFLVFVGIAYMLFKRCGMESDAENAILDGRTGLGEEVPKIKIPVLPPPTNDVAEIEAEIRHADRVLDYKRHDAELWGYDILRRIEAIPNYEVQRRLANAYLDAMECLQPLDSHHENVSRSLYNIVLLWPTFTAVQSWVNDPERPFRLMYKTLQYYRQAIQALSKNYDAHDVGKTSRDQNMIRHLKGELQIWGNVALNAYLRSAEQCNLSDDRHALWKKRIEAIMRGDGDEVPSLAPGDFRTVRQSLYYLGGTVTNETRLNELEKESSLKKSNSRRVGF